MVRTKEFTSWIRPDSHSMEIDEQINAFIREHDISVEDLIDIKYTAYVEDNNESVTQALLIYNKKTKMFSREEWEEIKEQEKFNKWIGRI